jgi:hypothetical protein
MTRSSVVVSPTTTASNSSKEVSIMHKPNKIKRTLRIWSSLNRAAQNRVVTLAARFHITIDKALLLVAVGAKS